MILMVCEEAFGANTVMVADRDVASGLAWAVKVNVLLPFPEAGLTLSHA